ncbi:hypothetical protein C5167_034480 [Papaver somniferum]|uniref:SRR1-like domain-containing protein n=1 Tax=Papaver somniferum TaxID=3469 RepID=A0A4Y7KGJ7_PAPSO|nr:hypothetical protein C5167_034480 [Papaver somniferum]
MPISIPIIPSIITSTSLGKQPKFEKQHIGVIDSTILAKFAKSHQGEIQFVRSVVRKILASAGTDQLLHEPDASIPLIGLKDFQLETENLVISNILGLFGTLRFTVQQKIIWVGRRAVTKVKETPAGSLPVLPVEDSSMAEKSSQTLPATFPIVQMPVKSGEDWKVVVPRRGKQRRKRINPKIETIEQAPWAPTDIDTDPEKESKLMQKIQICMNTLENSKFYSTILNQILAPQILSYFTSVLASESKMQMVIYGIGSIDSYETPRLQLALAILIKRRFDWIGDIEVFYPVLSKTESSVLEALGCSVLSVNEQGRRQVLKPTMFFMPHCEAVLYDNLLQANWKAEFLNRIVLFGNSFEKYAESILEFKNLMSFDNSVSHVLTIQRFAARG